MPLVTRSVLFAVALMAAMVTSVGCGSAEMRTMAAHPNAAQLVSYERTGGMVTVRHRDGLRHRARLSAPGMRALRRALATAHFERPATAGRNQCADCFFFRLSHGGHTLSFSQLTAPARVNGVLRILTSLADRFRAA